MGPHRRAGRAGGGVFPPLTGPGGTGTIGITTGTAGPQTRRQVTTVDGYGDMLFRLKFNVVGDEGGNFIFAVIPFLKAPTASHGVGNGQVEGGINFPINYSLPAGFTLSRKPVTTFSTTATTPATTRSSATTSACSAPFLAASTASSTATRNLPLR